MSGDDYTRWAVICDPTKEFEHSLFNLNDIRFTASLGYWPDGIVWQHTHTGKKIQFTNGKLVQEKDHVRRGSCCNVALSA